MSLVKFEDCEVGKRYRLVKFDDDDMFKASLLAGVEEGDIGRMKENGIIFMDSINHGIAFLGNTLLEEVPEIMKSLIIKYSLDTNEYMDNRNIDEAGSKEVCKDLKGEAFLRKGVDFMYCLLSGRAYKHNNHLYALQKSAIEDYIKKEKGK